MNVILGSVNLCIAKSFVITLALLLYKGQGHLNPDRWLNLGRFGPILDIVAMVWCALNSVLLCFPVSLPVSVASLNYAAPVLAGFTLVATVY